ncbi:MAG TPA: hypothetical protein VNT60_02390 [Deinococcales bacterium]|nr:hypothetical protein [Deinococcales bacterium]
MNAYELNNVALMLQKAREQLRPGVTATLSQGPAGVPIDTYLSEWAANPTALGDGAVNVYRSGNSYLLGGNNAFVNALEGLRDLTGLPIAPTPVNPDEPDYVLLRHAEAVEALRSAGIIA